MSAVPYKPDTFQLVAEGEKKKVEITEIYIQFRLRLNKSVLDTR